MKTKLTKYEAAREIIFQEHRRRSSKTSAARAYKAAKCLGLTDPQARDLLGHMEYSDVLIETVPQLAAVHRLDTPEMTGSV